MAKAAGPWVDEAAGRLIRPYAVSDGRTKPTAHFDLMTMVAATRSQPYNYLGPDHASVLNLCAHPVTVAEIAANVRLPAVVVKVLLSDLLESGAVTTRSFAQDPLENSMNLELLEAVRDGLRKRL
ncbi:MAG: DUF742 domain-containing protein [Micromonosporaceae bacterium]